MGDTYAAILNDFRANRGVDSASRLEILEAVLARTLEKLAAEEAARLARLAAAGVKT